MDTIDHWKVQLFIAARDGHTSAQARLVTADTEWLTGIGTSRRNPADPKIQEIGEEIAVARALVDLGHKLLDTAATDLEAVTHDRPRPSGHQAPTGS